MVIICSTDSHMPVRTYVRTRQTAPALPINWLLTIMYDVGQIAIT